MGMLDHLTCLLRNLYAGQEATLRTGYFQIMYVCMYVSLIKSWSSLNLWVLNYLFISDDIMLFSNPFTISVRVRRPAPRSEGKARAEPRPVRRQSVTSPTLPQPAPSREGANARSRERLGEARPGQSGLSAGDFYAYFDLFFLFLLWFIGYSAALCSASICWNFWSFFSCNWDLILLNCSQNKCLEWF